MASSSFSIDLDEVEGAATMIQRMHDDLQEAYIKLSTYVETVNKDIYGTDLVGQSLGGKTAAVIGLADQQANALKGFAAFIANTGKVAANLKTMAGSHRETDSDGADNLKKIGDGSDVPLPLPPAVGPGAGYVSPTPAPKPDYNHADERRDEVKPPPPGARNLM